MKKEFLICVPNSKHGSFLLKEILLSGNMGYFDDRLASINKDTRWKRFMLMNKHNLRLFRYYPAETFWAPFSRIKIWGWRKVNGWI